MQRPVLRDTIIEVTAVAGPVRRLQLRLASGGTLTAAAVIYAAAVADAARPHWWQAAAQVAADTALEGGAKTLQLAADVSLPDLDLAGAGKNICIVEIKGDLVHNLVL